MTTGRSAAVEREAVEEAARVGVVLGVDEAVRIRVPAQELMQAQGVGAVRRADDDDAAVDMADQADAAQDERAHDDLADVGLGRDEAAKVGALDAQQPARLAGARADEHLALVEEVELAGELARAQDDEDLRQVVLVDVEDLDRSLEDDEEVDVAVAAREDRRALGEALLAAVARDPRHHLRSGAGRSAPRADRIAASSAVSRALCCCASAAPLLSLSAMRAVYERRAARPRPAGRFRHAASRRQPRPG